MRWVRVGPGRPLPAGGPAASAAAICPAASRLCAPRSAPPAGGLLFGRTAARGPRRRAAAMPGEGLPEQLETPAGGAGRPRSPRALPPLPRTPAMLLLCSD